MILYLSANHCSFSHSNIFIACIKNKITSISTFPFYILKQTWTGSLIFPSVLENDRITDCSRKHPTFTGDPEQAVQQIFSILQQWCLQNFGQGAVVASSSSSKELVFFCLKIEDCPLVSKKQNSAQLILTGAIRLSSKDTVVLQLAHSGNKNCRKSI